eukprot:747159-Rhodomonas_salina.3
MNPVQNLYHECAKVAHYNNEDLKTVAAAMGRIDLECLGESEVLFPLIMATFSLMLATLEGRLQFLDVVQSSDV